MKRKILWLSNCPITGSHGGATGTWLSAMAHALIQTDEIELANISQTKIARPIQQNFGKIQQWLMPYENLNRQGLPSSRTIQEICKIIDTYEPDLIHAWGTENYWGLLTARKRIPGPALLEMQGIKYACAKVYNGGLSLRERFECIGLLEILRPQSSVFLRKKHFKQWGQFEKEMILSHDWISTQSDWVRAHVDAVNPNAKIFKTGILLRKEFYEAKPYAPETFQKSSSETVFTMSSGATEYKGLHVLLRAVSLLKRKFPKIRLKIAGNQVKDGIRKSGYVRWLEREIRRLGILDNIDWLGPLDAAKIIEEVHQASVVVIPSFVESYCLSLAETMLLGAPLVVSFAGAMPELARDNDSALFFPPGDEMACANMIEKILSNQTLASHLGETARKIGIHRNDSTRVVTQQLNIYKSVLSSTR